MVVTLPPKLVLPVTFTLAALTVLAVVRLPVTSNAPKPTAAPAVPLSTALPVTVRFLAVALLSKMLLKVTVVPLSVIGLVSVVVSVAAASP